MTKPRYLTKSRFKLAMDCPTKLYYTGKKEYANTKIDDPFLEALAEGGFQVGELAKCYFPGGHDVTTLDYDKAEARTNELLQNENVVIYEPAIRYQNLFIRIDVLVKRGNHLELIEVKAKSFDPDKHKIVTNDGALTSSWSPYIYDVAFQTYVLEHALPQCTVEPYLMLADKHATCPTDGLNQKFLIVRDENLRKGVQVSGDLNAEDLSRRILIQLPVSEYVQRIFSGEQTLDFQEHSFADEVARLAQHYENDEKIPPVVRGKCRDCEFRCAPEDEQAGLKNGFKECWTEALGWNEADFASPNILAVWDFRNPQKGECIQTGRLKMSDLSEDDINPKPDKKPGLSRTERQWLQIDKATSGDTSPYIDAEGLRREMSRWTYPLHFIDFETSMVAIPFFEGQHPYEGIAFQFSHHIVHEDGTVAHVGQYLNDQRGVFPNFEFIREFKRQLEGDSGTIFRYSNHENTYLNMILRQLYAAEVDDREELGAFIKSITRSTGKSTDKWKGERCMVDLWELEKRYYYDPHTGGSNSIKYVLPAILNSSTYLQQKYGQPIYGSPGGIQSLNFRDRQWIQFENGQVRDPYQLLPSLFEDCSNNDLELLCEGMEIKDGGAALSAYARMQFTQMSDEERQALTKALLKYCELDTLAMVMIYEGWREFIR